MKRAVAVVAMLVGMLLAQLAVAQDLRPQVVPEDRSTPRGTLKLLKTALEQGNAEQIKAIVVATNPTEHSMVDAMARTAVAVKALQDAAIAAYGADAAKPLTGETAGPGPDGLTELDKASETIAEDGNSATVSFADIGKRSIKLTKQGEQWQLPVGELKQLDAGAMAERMAEVKALNAVVEEITAEVAAKKYKTAEEAKQALYNKVVQSATPATRPSTQPTTRTVER